MKRNDVYVAIEQELQAHNVSYRVENGGKHYKFRWFVGDRSGFVTCPVSPSDHRSAANARASVRRLLASLGVRIKPKKEQDMPEPVKRQSREVSTPPPIVMMTQAEINGLIAKAAKEASEATALLMASDLQRIIQEITTTEAKTSVTLPVAAEPAPRAKGKAKRRTIYSGMSEVDGHYSSFQILKSIGITEVRGYAGAVTQRLIEFCRGIEAPVKHLPTAGGATVSFFPHGAVQMWLDRGGRTTLEAIRARSRAA